MKYNLIFSVYKHSMFEYSIVYNIFYERHPVYVSTHVICISRSRLGLSMAYFIHVRTRCITSNPLILWIGLKPRFDSSKVSNTKTFSFQFRKDQVEMDNFYEDFGSKDGSIYVLSLMLELKGDLTRSHIPFDSWFH